MARPSRISWALLNEYDRIHHQLARRPHVLATAIGLKETDGELTDDVSIIALVSKKFPEEALSAQGEKVPISVKVARSRFPTDVVPLNRFRLEQIGQDRGLKDGQRLSTLTSYGSVGKGNKRRPVAVTCEHGLRGPDQNSITYDPVSLWVPSHKKWIPIGASAYTVRESGLGRIPNNFGAIDSGYVHLAKAGHAKRVLQMKPAPILPPPSGPSAIKALLGQQLIAEGLKKIRVGVVRAVFVEPVTTQKAFKFRARLDLLLHNASGLSQEGDSGMLWKDGQGRGVAIHFGGDGQKGKASRHSFATFAGRAAARLEVTFVE